MRNGVIMAVMVLAALASSRGAAGQSPSRTQGMDLGPVTKMVQANGLTFPVADHGRGPAVLLLHGFPDDRYLWRYQVPALAAAGFRVIAPDMRGFGSAPRPQDPKDYGLGVAVRDVIGILDALEVRQVQLVGHDWGAAVGWQLAALYPDRVTRYVAMSVGAPGGVTTIEQREKSWYMAFFRQTGTAEEQLQRDNWQLFREWSRNPTDLDRYIENLSRPGALTAALNWYRAAGPQTAAAPGAPPAVVTCPVLGIWSDRDHYLTEDRMRTSGERIKGLFRYEKVTGASHWMMVDRPDEVNRLLLGFLQK
jgi:pimeloyl-ACP methyl ester carboxylesterase